jgi:4-deoxy-L-threo-5-hexosulose-uronate ketol-isomerase
VTLRVETRHALDPAAARGLGAEALRARFGLADMFRPGEIRLVYSHYDRMILGGAVPDGATLTLDRVAEAGTPSLLDRRELVVVNIGAAGAVEAAGATHALARGDMLYLGLGAGPVRFAGGGRFYLVSAPAHAAHPSRPIRAADAARVTLGSPETSNVRTIHKFVHPEGAASCQLVVGLTRLAAGSVWNTMPAHVHARRMEAYLYIDLPEHARVFHLMGEPDETRHLVLKNEEGAISPPWSIHSGAGTAAYAFIWAMAGDNVDYGDVDPVAMEDLR